MTFLNDYGFHNHFSHLFDTCSNKGLIPARICSIRGNNFYIITESGEAEAVLTGNILNTREEWELPKVGDWVTVYQTHTQFLITDILSRQNEFTRKMPGKRIQKQVIAANIDTVFIVQGLNRDFNIMRLQRYLQQVAGQGIDAVIVLTKADLVNSPLSYKAHVTDLGYNVPVITINNLTGEGLNEIIAFMDPRKTYVMVGSSGVGKSSLMNVLRQDYSQVVSGISSANHKGRHTTTFRQLTLLPNGSLLIDSPGTREFGLSLENSDSGGSSHPGISELAKHCKFANCRHDSEPECAVKNAVDNDKLSKVVYKSYIKLLKEQEHYEAELHEQRKTQKSQGKISRQVQQLKRKNRN
jgi:ribosome biogenesis GTPase